MAGNGLSRRVKESACRFTCSRSLGHLPMNDIPALRRKPAATLPLSSSAPRSSRLHLPPSVCSETLGSRPRLKIRALRAAMEAAFGGSDAEGAWNWKLAYDACEAATVLFLRKFGPAMRARAGTPAALLGDARQARRLASVADPPLGGEPGVPAILDADRARLCRRRSRRHDCGRSRARALGRHRPARDLRRTRRRHACSLNELADGRAGLLARLFPGIPRHAIRRGAHPRSSRCRVCGRASC